MYCGMWSSVATHSGARNRMACAPNKTAGHSEGIYAETLLPCCSFHLTLHLIVSGFHFSFHVIMLGCCLTFHRVFLPLHIIRLPLHLPFHRVLMSHPFRFRLVFHLAHFIGKRPSRKPAHAQQS